MAPEKIDSLADDVKPLVLGLLRQISGLTARVDELLAQNQALLARIAELEAEHGKPPKTPDNSSLPRSEEERRRAGDGEESPQRPSGRGASARREPGRDTRHLRRALRVRRRARRGGQELARAWDHVDLPPIKPITTRINLFRATCPCCMA